MGIRVLTQQFLDKVRLAGYDGFDTWIPKNTQLKAQMFDYLQKHEMYIVTHQHQDSGTMFSDFKLSFQKNLSICAEPKTTFDKFAHRQRLLFPGTEP